MHENKMLKLVLPSVLAELYPNCEKTMKKQPKKARKTTDFNPKLDKNKGSEAKLYYD